ncbi:MAG TPA: hypothetical protein VM695_14630 [Phycisphaerae bacterium]|nr:hypothetical protein [Phycisphaerae bacterium]
MRRMALAVAVMCFLAGLASGAGAAGKPENLALKARATADSEYSAGFCAAMAVDGKVPKPLERGDAGQAWAVLGDTHRNGAALTLEWPDPVAVAELVYYSRCAGEWNENFKDYELYADDAKSPAAKGRLAPGRGAQRMKLAKSVLAKKLRVRFTSSYGGSNPGASEIEVYSVSPPASMLGEFVAKPAAGFAAGPRAARRPRPLPPIQESPELLAEVLAGPMKGVEEIVFALRHPGGDGHWYANFAYYARSADQKAYGPAGGKLCRLNVRTGEVTTILDDPEGSVRDPQVHYDGRRVVFSYRKGGGEHFHLYEIDLDRHPSAGSGQAGLRQITPDAPYDDIEPCYLPDGGIMFCSSRCKRWVNCWLTQVAVLYRCESDGSGLRALSSNLEHENTPWPLPDGRVLYQRWEYVDRSQVHYHHLWTTNPDGTGQMTYFGNFRPGVVMIDAKPIPTAPRPGERWTEKTVALFSPGHGQREHAGPICVVDPRMGPDDGAAVRQVTRGGGYRDPWAFSEHAFLAAQGRRILLLDDQGRQKVLYTDEQFDVHEPRPLMPRPRERVIAPRSDEQQATGRLVLADVHVGRSMEGVRPGEIKKLLVVESLPKPINYTGGMDPLSYGGTFTLERVVGTVPVEPDGSAYMELPALRSFFFVALDANDLSVKRMQSFLTVQPGETTGCVGCHEQRTQTILPGNLLATRRPPSAVEPIASVPDVLDFPRDVQPVLDRHCVRCHDYDRHDGADYGPRSGGVILTGDRGPMFSHSYAALTIRKQFVDGRNDPRSSLPPRSIGTSASAIMKKIAEGHHGVKLPPREVDVVRYWIESGAAYPGTYAALGTGMIGGYYSNGQVLTDYDWPETKAAAQALARRCDACHKGPRRLPHALSDENGLSFWRPNWNDPRLNKGRHLVFNLTRPEKSLVLLMPLAKAADGYATKDASPKANDKAPPRQAAAPPDGHQVVFASTSDADYQAILAMLRRGRETLEEIKRFDMPGFRPREAYVREMKRYGVLPASFDAASGPIDVYATDAAYWRSLWHRPDAK